MIIPALVFNETLIACALLLVSGYLDALDGTVARLKPKNTRVGSMLDIVGDRIVEFSVILGLYLIDPIDRGITSILMLSSILICVTSFVIVNMLSRGTRKAAHYSPGLIERFEAFAFFFAMILFPEAFNTLGTILSILIFFTALVRVAEFCRKQVA
jgi:phosphatidylglycerophosphate synthase